MRNYIIAGKVNFEGSLNDWEPGGEEGVGAGGVWMNGGERESKRREREKQR